MTKITALSVKKIHSLSIFASFCYALKSTWKRHEQYLSIHVSRFTEKFEGQTFPLGRCLTQLCKVWLLSLFSCAFVQEALSLHLYLFVGRMVGRLVEPSQIRFISANRPSPTYFFIPLHLILSRIYFIHIRFYSTSLSGQLDASSA